MKLRKYSTKLCLILALTILCLFLMPVSANAANHRGFAFAEEDLETSLSGWLQEGNSWYYLNELGEKQTGWLQLNGNWYYFASSGAMHTGWLQLSGKWYYFASSGIMQTGWLQLGSTWYYLNSNGEMVTGKYAIEGKLHNFDTSGKWLGASDLTDWVKDGDNWYYYKNGIMQTGWLKLGAAYYYLGSDGVMQTGWLQQNGLWYYLDDKGVMAVGKVFIGEQPHKFTLDGVWQGTTANAFSSEGMRILKLEEGFSYKPYWDYGQWTVGYGTRCPDDMVEYYTANGISEADAQILLTKHMASMEAEVDNFVQKYGLVLNGHQYDALIMFSYNCGTAWCSETDGTFHNMIKNQATGNDLIRGFVLWCSAGGEIKDFLVRRRMCEANMYLNGVYSQTPPENFCFVTYDANGGSTSPRSQGYDGNLTAEPYPVPTYEGYIFDGWYTAKTGGTKVTMLDLTHNNTTLYARWTTPAPAPDSPVYGPSTVTITVNDGPVNVRTGPGVNYEKSSIGLIENNQSLTLTEYAIGLIDSQTGATSAWGKFSEFGGGWICLKYTDYDAAKQQITAVRWTQKDGSYYCYLGIEPTSGWVRYNNQWYYTTANGKMVTGWVKEGNTWYYMHSSGAMATGWLQLGNTWYYLSGSGAMVTGIHAVGSKLHSFDASGKWLGEVNQSGWMQVSGKWYYVQNGAMKTGWLQLGSTWYYLKSNGEMATGWQKVGNTWYYLSGSGAMKTGWLQLGGTWYYLHGSGAMATGSVQLGAKVYNFASSGACLNP